MNKFFIWPVLLCLCIYTAGLQAQRTGVGNAEKPFKIGLTLGLNHGIYLGLGDDRIHLTNLSYGLTLAYVIDQFWWLNLSVVKDNQISLEKAGQNSSQLCQSAFASNFLKMPGRCGSLIWRADLLYKLKDFEVGGGLASHNHGGFTFQEQKLLNSHFKQVTLSAIVAKRYRLGNRYITPLFRLEKSIFFSSAIDDDVDASSWLFSLEIYFHWSIL